MVANASFSLSNTSSTCQLFVLISDRTIYTFELTSASHVKVLREGTDE